MAVDFSTMVYLPAFDAFARPVTIFPIASQPGAPSYSARGIYDTRPADVIAEDNSIYSDQQTILDIREAEFAILPVQFDRVTIPVDVDAGPGVGDFEVADADTNGGGETTLLLRKIVP